MLTTPSRNSAPGEKNETLSQIVYQQLKQEILNCDFKPGQLVNESELIRKYAVSKTPVREALKRLSQERYINSVPGACYIIAPITLRDVGEICELRGILEEATAVRVAVAVTDAQLRELDSMVGEVFVVGTRDDLIRWYAINSDFHLALARLARNARLEQALRDSLEALTRFLVNDRTLPMHTEAWVLQHKRIVDALKTRDPGVASHVMHAHMDAAKMVIEQSLLAEFAHTTA